MFVSRSRRLAKAFSGLLFTLALSGCFGTGDGPEQIAGTPAPPPPPLPPGFCDNVNFEDPCPPSSINNFAGGATTIVENPNMTGINTSERVAQMQKFTDQPFGGTTIDTPSGIDFTQGQSYRMKVLAPRAVPVLFKFEGLDRERSLSHTGSGQWESLCFDFTNDTMGPAVTGITIIFDLGVQGDAANDPNNWTFYYDDIEQVSDCSGGPVGVNLPVDFEQDPTIYNFGMDGGFGGGAASVLANPVSGGINTSAQVARMQKFMGEVFGGSTLSLAGNVDFSQGQAFRMKVWSQRAVPVLFKFEGLDKERSVSHTGGSEWQDLCFDFTGDTAGPATNAITTIFDLGVVGDAMNDPDNWTFYFDDIQQVASCSGGGGGGGTGSLPTLDFESAAGGTGFTWNVFENADNPPLTFIANPDMSGINTSATVAEFTARQAGQPFAGTNTADLPTFTLDASNAIVKVMVWKTVISDVGIKFEDANLGSTGEIRVANTVTNQWEELTFDFTSVIGNPVNVDITGFVVFPDFDARGQDNVIYIDNITFGDGSTGGGGGGGGSTGTVVADFEAGGTFNFDDFGGGAASVEANPDTSGINPSAQAARLQKFNGEVFAGSTLLLDNNVDFSLGTAYNIKVYATRPVEVLFKLEGLDQERSESHGGTGWETLCFDFTGATSGNPATAFTFIFDLGTAGDADNNPDDWTFFVDDIEQTSGCGGSGNSATFPVDFEADPMSFDFGPDAGFGGGATVVVANPVSGGINTTAQVARMQKFMAEPFGGSSLTLDGSVDFTAGTAFRMKVWSQRAVPVLFKFEGLDRERTLTHTGGSEWQDLCFDFTGDTAGNSTDTITFIFDNGVVGDAMGDPDNWTFYFDDITQVADCGVPPASFPVDFEADPMTYDFGPMAGFGGGASVVVANPVSGGINTSAQVARMQKFAAEPFGGSTFELGGNVDFTGGQAFTMKVWSQRSVPVLFKFEGLDRERSVTHSGGSEWQDLCFDFTGDTAGPVTSQITFIFDNGVNGDATNDPDNWTFYFDDITQVASCPTGGGGGGGTSSLPTLDFESAAGGTGFTWTVFENADNPAVAFIPNPDQSGINTSATVAEFTARAAGATFAGANTTDLPTFTLDASNAVVKIMVWKTVISDVGIKFEKDLGGSNGIASTGEIRVPNTVTNQWEELTFDFTSVIGDGANVDITGFVIFPDFAARAGENVIFFDNITFSDGAGGGSGGGGGGTSAPALTDFESGTFDFTDFGGGVGSIEANPDTSGINTSALSARIQKFAGEPFGGTTLGLPGAVDFSSGEAYNIKVYATRSVDVLFKLEGLDQERTVTHGGTGWETLCFDFTGMTSAAPATAFTFIFDNGTQGDAAGNPDDWTFFVDDIEQTSSCGGGGGTSALPVLDFESPEGGTGFTWTVFENDDNPGVAFIPNPDQSGINTSATVAEFTARAAGATFAGTNTTDLPTFTLDASNAVVKIMVWKTVISDVGIKFEKDLGAGNGIASTGEIRVPNTVTNQWEELTFDFTSVIGDGANVDITGFVIFPDFDTRAGQNVIFFDNITFSDGAGGGSGGGATIAVPVDFEEDAAEYDFGPDAGFGGGVSTVIANPDMSGINTTAQVAQMQKFAGAVFGGSTLALDTAIDFGAGEAFTVKVWSAREVPVLYKLEGLDRERSVTHPGGSEWQELCFDFTGDTTGPASSAVTFIFDLGVNGDADNNATDWTFYYDEITQVTSCGGSTSALPVLDFESPEGGTGFTWTVFENDDNPGVAFIPNPDQSGINTSATVAEFTARAAGATFAGTNTTDLPTFTLDASNAIVKIMVWKTVISDVGIKFEKDLGAGNGIASTGEIRVPNTVTNQWEELTFDFTSVIGDGANVDITGFVIFPDFDTRAGQNVIFFDNITFGDGSGGGSGAGGGGTTSAPALTDFESGSFTFTDFGGGVGSIEANPETAGTNTSSMAARIQKFADQPFGGTTLGLPGAVDFAAGEAYNIKVYATRNVNVLFKLEGLDQERTVTHGGSGWENLCFDFSGSTTGDPATDFTFIFDNGVVGDAAGDPANWTFFVDDIEQVASCATPTVTVLPIDFEADPMTYVFRDGGGFGGGTSDVIANPQSGGINTSAQVGRMQKFDGEVFGGSTLDLGGDFGFLANTSFTMKVYASRSVPVLFKLEGGPVGEVSVTHTGSGWEELCFDFGALSGNGTDGITLIFDNGVNGAAATAPDDWTFLFDDIAINQGTACPMGGGGSGGMSGGLPILDFESSAGGTGFTWSVFENDDNPGLAFLPNPDTSGINPSATAAQFTARTTGQPFAGTITNDLPTFTLDSNNAIVKVMVYKSVISDVGIKFENGTQGSTGEILVPNTVTNQWEELTFDFTAVIGNGVNTDITGFIVFPDFDARATQNVVYFDNIRFGDGS